MTTELATEIVATADVPALEVMQRAEIDVQITTAKRYPRSIQTFVKRATAMAIIDEETAESCIYRRPVGKENGKPVYAEGMSVRLAEIVGASYGNLRVGAIIIEQTERQVKARGMAFDLESNFASSSEVVESTVDRNGKPFTERMRTVIAKAALAKARRDATFQVVPKSLAKPIEAEVRRLLVGDAKSLEQRRRAVVGWINKLGIAPGRVYAALGVKGEADLTPDHLETLTGIKTSIKEGETSIDEAFPDPEIVQKRSDEKQADSAAEAAAGLAPATKETPKEIKTPQQELAELVFSNGFDFTTFQRWAKDTGNPENADSLGSFDEVPTVVATRLLKARTGLLGGLKAAKGGAQ